MHCPRNAARVKLKQELCAAFCLIGFADRGGHQVQPEQAAKKPVIAWRSPAHIAGTAPTVGAQRVESTVIPDAVCRVPLDYVATDVAEGSPTVEITRIGCHDGCNRSPCLRPTCCRHRCCLRQLMSEGCISFWEHRGWKSGRELNRLICHFLTLRADSTYRDMMLALTLGAAKNIAMLVVVVLAVLALGAAWLMKTMAQKAALAVILGLLAVIVWTQRSSLSECADKVREAGVQVDTTCSFLGKDVEISTTRDS